MKAEVHEPMLSQLFQVGEIDGSGLEGAEMKGFLWLRSVGVKYWDIAKVILCYLGAILFTVLLSQLH